MQTNSKDLALSAAYHWEQLAAEAERMAEYERARGIDLSRPGCSPGDHKARTYRQVARALILEAKTGKPHCSCHHLTLPDCAVARGHRR